MNLQIQFDDNSLFPTALDAAAQPLLEAGGTMHHDPVNLGTTMAIYCRDPFGNIVELMQPVST
jgi:predicted enzyme related to lactoylglutathione lyase